MTQKIIPIFDAGHGYDTAGKCWPEIDDGTQVQEWEFNRDIVASLALRLEREGIRSYILVPEHKDIPLSERSRRANEFARGKNTILLSVHSNAGGGNGIEAYTSPGITRADALATVFLDELKAEFKKVRFREDWSDGDPDREARFHMLTQTSMPAILVELFFMDNDKERRMYLTNPEGRARIVNALYNAVKRIVYG